MKYVRPQQSQTKVVALNNEAEIFLALASKIRGAAVGWSPAAISLLSQGIGDRFGDVLGADQNRATINLIELATTPISS